MAGTWARWFPDAKQKFFLTASVDARAEGRLRVGNKTCEYWRTFWKELKARDERDMNRPLKCLQTPISLITTTELSAAEAVEKFLP